MQISMVPLINLTNDHRALIYIHNAEVEKKNRAVQNRRATASFVVAMLSRLLPPLRRGVGVCGGCFLAGASLSQLYAVTTTECTQCSCIHRLWWWSLQLLRRWGFYPAATTTLSTAAQCSVLVVGGLPLSRATVRQEHRQRPPRLPSGSGRRQLRLSSNVPAGNQLRRRQLGREDRARHYVWGHGSASAHLLGGGATAILDVYLVGGLVKDASNRPRHRAIHGLAKPS